MSRPDEWAERQESTTVTVDGRDVEVAYYDEGSGDPVLFLHGIPTWSFLWRDVVTAVEGDRRVVVPDMVGYGNSSMADSFDRSIRAQEQMVEGLLADLAIDTVSFVGHDLGGGVGLRYASHEPDAVDELVLSNAVAYDSWPVEPITDLGVPSNVEEMGVDELRETLAAMFRETLVADDPDEEFVDAMASQWASERGATSLSRNAVATNTNHTTELDYGAVDADALMLWGADDELQPLSYADRLADDVGGEVRGLDGATHWVMQDRPDAYREELASFLLD